MDEPGQDLSQLCHGLEGWRVLRVGSIIDRCPRDSINREHEGEIQNHSKEPAFVGDGSNRADADVFRQGLLEEFPWDEPGIALGNLFHSLIAQGLCSCRQCGRRMGFIGNGGFHCFHGKGVLNSCRAAMVCIGLEQRGGWVIQRRSRWHHQFLFFRLGRGLTL